jgi:hypothetical protein
MIPSANRRAIFCARTSGGKTTNFVSLLIKPEFLKDYFDEIHLYSPNASYEPEHKLIGKFNKNSTVKLIDEFVSSDFDKTLKEIKADQKERKSNSKSLKKILIILDDFITDPRFFKNKSLNDCFISGRKFGITTWVLSQYYKKIPDQPFSFIHINRKKPANQRFYFTYQYLITKE